MPVESIFENTKHFWKPRMASKYQSQISSNM